MNKRTRFFWIPTGIVILLLVCCHCSAVPQDSELSLTGQVLWQDIEGGFYGIITPEGTRYLPQNLPESYQVDGVTVHITGTVPSDVMTIQMWGEPLEIQSISPVHDRNPFLQPWYPPAGNQSYSADKKQAEHLIMAASGLQTGLDAIDERVSSMAHNLSVDGGTDQDLRTVLRPGLDMSGVYTASFTDVTGKVTTIVPDEYARFEGEDVSGQDHISRLITYPVPGMSGYFMTKEGMNAVILSYPVFSAGKKVTGYVSVLFDPGNLTENYSLPFLNGTDYDLMVAQPDGKILYDAHPGMNGQETWDNPIFTGFPDLLSWAAHYQNAKAGTDQYSYYRGNTEDIAKTDVIWTTVSLHGTSWRIFLLNR